jgi:hypothetical protein
MGEGMTPVTGASAYTRAEKHAAQVTVQILRLQGEAHNEAAALLTGGHKLDYWARVPFRSLTTAAEKACKLRRKC